MTLRITDDFTLTRSDGHPVVEVFGAFPARVRLTLEEVQRAVSMFAAAAAMMEAAGQEEELEEAA